MFLFVVLLLTMLSLLFAPFPYLWVFLLLTLFWGRVTLTVRRRIPKIVSLNLTILMLILALLEGGLTVQEWVRVASSTYEIEYSDNYVGFDPVLGTVANQSGTARLKIRDQTLYDVHYTLNDQGLRVTPEPNQPDAPAVLFFGCSFSYGEGVEDWQSFPYLVGEGLEGDYRVLNLSFHGYSANQMLTYLETDKVDELLQGSTPKLVVYTCIPNHVPRVVGHRRFASRAPRYELNADGRPVRNGLFIDKTPLFRYLWYMLKLEKDRSALGRRLLPHRRTDEQLQLWLSLVEQSRREVSQRWPEAKFAVLFWGLRPKKAPPIVTLLQQRGIEVDRVLQVCPGIEKEVFPYDGHPNVNAHRAVADYILKRFFGRSSPQTAQ